MRWARKCILSAQATYYIKTLRLWMRLKITVAFILIHNCVKWFRTYLIFITTDICTKYIQTLGADSISLLATNIVAATKLWNKYDIVYKAIGSNQNLSFIVHRFFNRFYFIFYTYVHSHVWHWIVLHYLVFSLLKFVVIISS